MGVNVRAVSNASIKQRIAADSEAVEAGTLALADFSKTLAVNLAALESMPYPLVQQGRSIALHFEQASWSEDEGLKVQRSSLLDQLKSWLDAIPE